MLSYPESNPRSAQPTRAHAEKPTELAAHGAQVAELEAKIADENKRANENADAAAMVDRLRDENARLKQERDDAGADCLAATEQRDALRDENARLREHLRPLVDLVHTLDKLDDEERDELVDRLTGVGADALFVECAGRASDLMLGDESDLLKGNQQKAAQS